MEKKTLYIICGGCIGFLLLVLVGIWLLSLLSPKYYTYEEAEEVIKEATENYYLNNPTLLPVDDGKYNLSYEALVQAELIKPLSEIIKGGETCSATVTIIKQEGLYSYIPILNCGAEYTTRSLVDKILADNQVVTQDSGLYNENGEYFFKGKVTNNYVAYGSYVIKDETTPFLWRIVSIKDGQIKLKAINHTGKKVKWDSRYNAVIDREFGYNDFDYSEMKEALKDLEKTFNHRYENPQLDLSKLVATNLCIGKRELEDPISKGNLECNTLSKDKYFFGTITPYEYMRASTDKDCIAATSKACQNYNYLLYADSEWTITTVASDNYNVFAFDTDEFELYRASISKPIYPTIILNEYAYYKGGNGTIDEPYIVK